MHNQIDDYRYGDERDYLGAVSGADVSALLEAAKHYGASWRKRGGVGAFMMLARKWDRLEKKVTEHKFDIFEAAASDERAEGVIDDIRDLRRYLLLVEAWLAHIGHGRKEVEKGAPSRTPPKGLSGTWQEMSDDTPPASVLHPL